MDESGERNWWLDALVANEMASEQTKSRKSGSSRSTIMKREVLALK
jgi:hypothetical protein